MIEYVGRTTQQSLSLVSTLRGQVQISMHRVRAKVAKERRLERLSTPSAKDNRISFGCVNIPAQFYETVVSPTFAQTNAVVYILPEVKPLQQAFSFDVSMK